ncbi:MAG: DEAD/DEAH box helicase [Candidatus Komeilibacteria bacterium]
MSVIKVNGLLHYNAVGRWLTRLAGDESKLAVTPLVKSNRAILYLTDSDRQVKNLADSYQLWSGLTSNQRQIITWAEAESPIPVLTALLNNDFCLIVAHQSCPTIHVPNVKELANKSLHLQLGDKRQIRALIDQLVKLGYTPNITVNKSLEIATRGNIIDIGLDSAIIRLEFDGTKLEAISRLDMKSQTKISNYQFYWLLPATLPQSQHLFREYCSDKITVIGEQDFGLEQQVLLTNFEPSAASSFQQSWPDISGSNPSEAIKKIQHYQNFTTYWLTREPEQAQTVIQEHHLPLQVITLAADILQTPPGWIDQIEKLLVLNDSHLLPNKQSTRTKRAFLSEITIGDLIVHRDHGVGRLEAVTTIPINGRQREYLVLAYASNDKIYLPTDQAGKISKYVGSPNPKISRLSSDASWIGGVKKIKAETWQLALTLLNTEARRRLTFTAPMSELPEEQSVAADFAFTETPSQLRTLDEVMNDLAKDYPTERLVCGDVGFGKTEIALRASWRVALHKGQTVLICPTTLLAQQHFDTFQERLEKYGTSVVLLSRWQTEKEQTEIIDRIKKGTVDIIIGTHRALSADVHFANLRLLIIDEEQNFGVKDKEKLKKIATHLHIISLSATPIPRTLHLAMSQLRGISLLTEPPAGRQPIITQVEHWNEAIIKQALQKELERQGQTYYLHNKVETIDLAAKQIQDLMPQARIAVAHGQMNDEELAGTMHKFDLGEIDILVCSTIIANGLDLPNVNTIIITDCVNFGLAQLHQLRGRVGRGDKQAYCYLLYKEQRVQGQSLERLKTLESQTELGAGFKIASRDMELRGVGHILGRKQHGHVTTLGLNLFEELLNEAIEELRTGQAAYWREIDIDLPLAESTEEYIFESTQEKIHFWQKISWIRSAEELDEERQKMKKPTTAMTNAIYLQELKIFAQETPVTRITSRRLPSSENSLIELQLNSPLTPTQIQNLTKHQPCWIIAQEQIKLKTEQLSHWQSDLLHAMQLLSNRKSSR